MSTDDLGDSATILLRCMAAVAGADGRVDDIELEEISAIHVALTGRAAPIERLRAEVDAAWNGGLDPATLVAAAGAEADLATRTLIAQACYRVLTADGEITGPEAHTFNAIVRGLGLSREDVVRRLE